MANPPLPPGFELVQETTSAPPLPPGFEAINTFDDPGVTVAPDFSGVQGSVDTTAEIPQPRTFGQEALRSLGLGARSLIGGASDLVGIVSNPFIEAVNLAGEKGPTTTSLITGQQERRFPRQMTQQEGGEAFADFLGLPRPETGTERFASGITRALGAGGGTIGLGRGLVAQAPSLAPTVASRIGQVLGAQPTAQVAGAALGSGASGIARELGASPTTQTIVGALGSVAGGAGFPAARAVSRPVTAPFQGVTQAGADIAVGDILRQGAQNVDDLYRTAPSAVPGVTRSLAEETLDPGIAALQRQYGSGPLRAQAGSANQARVEFITDQFGGANPLSAQGFRDQADTLAREASRGLRRASGEKIDNQAVSSIADAALARTRQVPIQNALNAAKDLVAQPFRTAAEAWDARQGLDALIRGKNSQFPDSKLAQKQLLLIKGALDRQMRNAYPGWSDFLRKYQGIQRQADQVEVGETLLTRGGASSITPEGVPTTALSPAKFRNLTDDLDQLARASTGFTKAKASTTITPAQVQAIQAVRDDVLRIAETQKTGVAGSPTQQNARVQDLINDAIENRAREILSSIPVVGGAGTILTNVARRNVERRLQEILANPEKARELLRQATPEERTVLESAIGQLGATTATTATTQGQI